MSYCKDYLDPFDRKACDDGDDTEEDGCAFPDRCLMPSFDHTRDECYTVEDAEAYYAEMEQL